MSAVAKGSVEKNAESCFESQARVLAAMEELTDISSNSISGKDKIIAADVLDAWFSPAPEACAAVGADCGWLLRTSPPTDGAGLRSTIAQVRGVCESNLVIGAGSSDLIFRFLPRLVDRGSKVLLLDPTYGEYAHLLERVLGIECDRFELDY